MICKNCGASFPDTLPKCPYCGAFHYAGAQKEYMGKLKSMKEGLDDLHETVPEMYTTELKTQAKHVRKIALVIVGILAILILLFFVSAFLLDSVGSRDEKAVLLFTWDHYPFLICYENISIFRESAARLDTDDFSDFDMQELFYCYISNRYYQKGYPLDENDQQLISSFEDEMESVINTLGLTVEETREFNDLLNSIEYPSWNEIEDFTKKVYKRMY